MSRWRGSTPEDPAGLGYRTYGVRDDREGCIDHCNDSAPNHQGSSAPRHVTVVLWRRASPTLPSNHLTRSL